MAVKGSDEYNAANKGPMVLAVVWSVTAVSTLFVVARLYVRGKMRGRLQGDDIFVVMALICGYVSTGLSTAAVASGNGRHYDSLQTHQKENAIMYTTAAFCPGIFSFSFPKLAVIFLLTRLLNPSRPHRIILWTMGIMCQVILLVTVGLLVGRCYPARSLWNFSVKGVCIDSKYLVNYAIFSGAYSAAVDLYLAVYPTFVLFKLHLSVKKKLALSAALGIGSISGIVAIYKSTRIPSLASVDFTYDSADLVIWTVVEGSTIIIGCTIPVLQPLLEMILKRNPFSSGHSNSKTKVASGQPRYYEDYTNNDTAIELGQRKQRSKVRDELGLTVIDDDSQENILGPGTKTTIAPVAEAVGQEDDDSRRSGGSPNNGNGIMRTNVITVQYEENNNGSVNTKGDPPQQHWRVV